MTCPGGVRIPTATPQVDLQRIRGRGGRPGSRDHAGLVGKGESCPVHWQQGGGQDGSADPGPPRQSSGRTSDPPVSAAEQMPWPVPGARQAPTEGSLRPGSSGPPTHRLKSPPPPRAMATEVAQDVQLGARARTRLQEARRSTGEAASPVSPGTCSTGTGTSSLQRPEQRAQAAQWGVTVSKQPGPP